MNRHIIGVAGGSCSGKSTFAFQLAAAFQPLRSTQVVGLDAFYTQNMQTGPTVTLSDGKTLFDFNHPAAIDAAEAVSAIDRALADVVIVEGLFTFAIEPIRQRLDSRVFVHLDADLRAIRRLLRDMKGGRASTDPEFIARYYIESARVGHANFVEPSRAFAHLTVIGDSEGLAAAVPQLVARVE